MHRFHQALLLSVFVGLFFSHGATATPLPWLELGRTLPKQTALVVTAQGILINIVERPLKEVLEHIEQESGIRFELSRGLVQVPITATIEAPDWPTAIKRLLRPFSRAELWDRQDRLVQVWVVERGEELGKPSTTTVEEIVNDVRNTEASDSEVRDAEAPITPSGMAFLENLASLAAQGANLPIERQSPGGEHHPNVLPPLESQHHAGSEPSGK